MKASRNGQVSIPAGARRRWNADCVVVVDLGDRIVVRPLPADPVGELVGKYRRGPATDTARLRTRSDGAAAEVRTTAVTLRRPCGLALLKGEPAGADVERRLSSEQAPAFMAVGVALGRRNRAQGGWTSEASGTGCPARKAVSMALTTSGASCCTQCEASGM